MKNSINDYNKVYDLLIVGCGPAGITAAIYAARAQLEVVIVEKEVYGGKVMKTDLVDNYPGFPNENGINISKAYFKHLQTYDNITYILNTVVDFKKEEDHYIVLTNGKPIKAKKVIVATGTKERKLNVPGEDNYFHKGVSYCAVCDGPIFKNKVIAVVGGGYSAVEEGYFLASIGSKVILINRSTKFRIESDVLEKFRNKENTEIIENRVVTEVVGNGKKVTSLITKDVITNKVSSIDADALFIYIGSQPEIKCLANIKELWTADKYLIYNKKTLESPWKGFFFAGDLIQDLKQITTAEASGTIAATEAIKQLLN